MATMSRATRPVSALQQQMRDDLELEGMSPKTQKAYTAAVRGLAKHYRKSPDQLTLQQVLDYILHLKRDRKLAIGTLRPIVNGIKFFYRQTVPRRWPALQGHQAAQRAATANRAGSPGGPTATQCRPPSLLPGCLWLHVWMWTPQ